MLELDHPRVMGIVNVTPDSFSDGGKFLARDAAIAHGRRLVEEGADIVDIGGESTRPGATAATLQEELDRLLSDLTRWQPCRARGLDENVLKTLVFEK